MIPTPQRVGDRMPWTPRYHAIPVPCGCAKCSARPDDHAQLETEIQRVVLDTEMAYVCVFNYKSLSETARSLQ